MKSVLILVVVLGTATALPKKQIQTYSESTFVQKDAYEPKNPSEDQQILLDVEKYESPIDDPNLRWGIPLIPFVPYKGINDLYESGSLKGVSQSSQAGASAFLPHDALQLLQGQQSQPKGQTMMHYQHFEQGGQGGQGGHFQNFQEEEAPFQSYHQQNHFQGGQGGHFQGGQGGHFQGGQGGHFQGGQGGHFQGHAQGFAQGQAQGHFSGQQRPNQLGFQAQAQAQSHYGSNEMGHGSQMYQAQGQMGLQKHQMNQQRPNRPSRPKVNNFEGTEGTIVEQTKVKQVAKEVARVVKDGGDEREIEAAVSRFLANS